MAMVGTVWFGGLAALWLSLSLWVVLSGFQAGVQSSQQGSLQQMSHWKCWQQAKKRKVEHRG
eukprot:3173187-Amphidinium_carterae.1